ncbi:hypothetical protein Tco_0215156 [Tanacetum coccineum]
MNFETRSSHVRIDRGGSFSSQIHGPALEENGTRHKLTNVLGTFGELHRRSDLVEISNVSMRVFFVMSKELLVLNEVKQTVLKLKVVCDDLGNNDGILVTLGEMFGKMAQETLQLVFIVCSGSPLCDKSLGKLAESALQSV